jgi:hypothetical protein
VGVFIIITMEKKKSKNHKKEDKVSQKVQKQIKNKKIINKIKNILLILIGPFEKFIWKHSTI